MSAPPVARPKPPPRAGYVGPLFKWELVRLARRGQDARARFLLASVLLVVLTVLTLSWFPHVPPAELFTGTAQVMTLQESANFAATFALTFVLAQLAVLVLLTPAYAAGGIADEKERKTYPFLLVTDLRDREIVFGKFLGRVVFLLGVMAAGLPVLALTLLFGGVSLKFLLMSYLLTATTIVLLAAIGVAAAATAETFRGALFRAYGFSAIHAMSGCGLHPVVSPFGAVVWLATYESEMGAAFFVLGFGYAAVQLALAMYVVRIAMQAVRRSRATLTSQPRRRGRDRERDRELVVTDKPVPANQSLPEAKRLPERLPVAVPRPVRVERDERDDWPRRKEHVPDVIADRPPVDADDPFGWKERHVLGVKRDADDDSIRGLTLAVGAVVGLLIAFFAGIAFLSVAVGGWSPASVAMARWLLLVGGGGGVFLYLLSVGTSACGAVCRERQRLTLESLLTIPVDRTAILGPKLRASAEKGWWWGVPAVGCAVLGLALSDAPVVAIPGAAFLAAVVPAAAAYGLWLSVRCRTITRAILWFAPVAGAAAGFPVVLGATVGVETAGFATTIAATVAGGAAVGGCGLWRLACQAFEREGRA